MPNHCKIENCSRPYYAKGLCSLHYQEEFRRKRAIKRVEETTIPSLDGELWRPVAVAPGSYAVSNKGRLKRIPHHRVDKEGRQYWLPARLLKPIVDKDGYYSYTLSICGKMKPFRAHRLVLAAFSPCDDMDNLQVNHINGVKNDNRLENLEWCTASENMRHRIYKLNVQPTHPIVAVRCIETGEVFPSLHAAVRHLGVSNHGPLGHILRAKNSADLTYKGYHWEYA